MLSSRLQSIMYRNPNQRTMPSAIMGVSGVSQVRNEKTGSPIMNVWMQSTTIHMTPKVSSGFMSFRIRQQFVIMVLHIQTT